MQWTRAGNVPTVELDNPLFLAQLSPGWVSLHSALGGCMKPGGGTKGGGGNMHRGKEKG